MGHLQGHHHAGLGLELATLGELRQLPHPYDVDVGAGVDEAIGGGDGQDLAVLFEHRRDAPVGRVGVSTCTTAAAMGKLLLLLLLFGGRRREGVKRGGDRGGVEAPGKGGRAPARRGVGELGKGGYFCGGASQELVDLCG